MQTTGNLSAPQPATSSERAALLPADALVRGRHSIGDFELTLCTDGTYLLDGGAMFGVVPKTLWSRRAPADDLNRITLGLNTTVVRTGQHTVLIETGIGNKQSPKMREIHQNQELLPHSLAAAGIRPEEVTHVINSHLHFDHCGWNTTLHPDGSVTPTFPNARYFAALGEVEHGHLQLERDAVSYLSPNYDPLIASGQMTLLDPHGLASRGSSASHIAGSILSPGKALAQARIQTDPEIVPGIRVERFPGHTASMLAVHIESLGPGSSGRSRTGQSTDAAHGGTPTHACYIADLIPTSAHLDITWGMGYDLDPLRVIEERKRFYSRAIPERWLVLFTHDHNTPAAHLTLNDKGRPAVL